MSEAAMANETIFDAGQNANRITGEVDRQDPGRPCIRLECGCNEFWLDEEEARAVLCYLHRTLPSLRAGRELSPQEAEEARRANLVPELRERSERLTRYTNSPDDGLMSAAADEIERLTQQNQTYCSLIADLKGREEGRQPIAVTEVVAALERESANTNTDPRWLAAVELRRIAGWEARTLMCRIDTRPAVATCNDCGSDDVRLGSNSLS